MNKIYLVESELHSMMAFDNELDRNEMALALWQEQIYFLWARTLNWYEDGILTGIEEDAYSNVHTYEYKAWYDVPTQVAWFDDGAYAAGIAYCDEIICACCGGVVSIEEVIEYTPEGVVPIVEYKSWIDFKEDILGDSEAGFYYEED